MNARVFLEILGAFERLVADLEGQEEEGNERLGDKKKPGGQSRLGR